MIDTIRTFENFFAGLGPQLLLVLAIVTIAAGLFVFLGGLSFRRAMFPVIGAYCGLACAVFYFGFNLMLALALAGAGALLALKLQESFLVFVASFFAAVYGFSILIRPYFSPSGELIVVIRQLTIGVPFYNWPILLALIVLPFVVISTSWRGASAVLCSAAGSVMLFAGVIMLLKHADFTVVGHISSKREIYLGLFVAVTGLGAIVQFYILPKISSRFAAVKNNAKAKAKRARKRKTDGGEVQSKATAWRTA